MARLTIDLPDSLHRELKTSAATLGISMREFVLQRIAAAPAIANETQNRWANLAEELKTKGSIDGLSQKLASNRTEFRDEFSTDTAGW